MSSLFNQTNIAPGTSFATGGGGGGSNLLVNTITTNSTTIDGTFGLNLLKNPNVPQTGTTLNCQYWAGQDGYNLTPTFTQLGNNFTDTIGVEGVRFASSLGKPPYGYIVAEDDGVLITGRDSDGNPTQDYLNTNSGQMKLMTVSTITNSAKTHTLDFNAFMSTMASVYPSVVSAYTPS